MAEAKTIMWPGLSGKEYKYWIYLIGTTFKEEAGNYIFAKEIKQKTWSPCYIGQTKNLNQRLENHEKETCATRNGATHIHVHLTPGGETVRRAEESDLLQKWSTPCNG